MAESNELRYYNALKRITKYQSVHRLKHSSGGDWGCSFEEALEMAYENVISEARNALGKRRSPKLPAASAEEEK